jgi:hypothetical protein
MVRFRMPEPELDSFNGRTLRDQLRRHITSPTFRRPTFNAGIAVQSSDA